MESGIISLKPLYQFVLKHRDADALNGSTGVAKEYFSRANEVVESIPQTQGFYLWGYYAANGLWRNVYLGKAGFGRTAHLRSRVREELKDERCCLWRATLTVRQLLAAGGKHYPSMWHKYKAHWTRSLRKAGATHIAWVSDPSLSNGAVANIEADLIETLNPSGNVVRPAPPASLQSRTHDVILLLRRRIHENREGRYGPMIKETLK